MTAEERLAAVVSALESAGVSCLVMGGHAVRFYGLARATIDFDLHVSTDGWNELPQRILQAGLFPDNIVVEGPSWRRGSFRRFRIGSLPDGRDEWVEFWKENHLLPPFEVLRARAERGLYGGRVLSFLSLDDLIRSKETERDADWADVAVLEQFCDARMLAQIAKNQIPIAEGLSSLRSRAGFELYMQHEMLTDSPAITTALATTRLPVTQAYLMPFLPDAPRAVPVLPIEPVIVTRLCTTAPGSALHLSLAEIVRRRYIVFRKELDRANKQQILGQPSR